MRLAISIAALVLSLSPAMAADGNGRFQIFGAGSLTCAAYNGASAQDKLYAETWWAGYVTAMNRSTADTYNLLGKNTVQQVNDYLKDWCMKNPNAHFAQAVHVGLEAAYDERTKQAP